MDMKVSLPNSIYGLLPITGCRVPHLLQYFGTSMCMNSYLSKTV